MGVTREQLAGSPNAETTEAWDGPLFERFLKFKHLITVEMGAHLVKSVTLFPPQPGWRVLDIGCGLGDQTQRLAGLVGPDGEAVGVDVAPRFIEYCVEDARRNGVVNARFELGDVQAGVPEGPFDAAYSRFGTMFFAGPVPALRNVRAALKPGGRLVMVVWRIREDNPWVYRAQQIAESFVERPQEFDEPTCGPGPFSMAGADTTSGILMSAGYDEISLRRFDAPLKFGRDLDEALDFVTALGPAGELLRIAGETAAALEEQVRAALREGLAEYERPDGTVWGTASTWIVSAVAP